MTKKSLSDKGKNVNTLASILVQWSTFKDRSMVSVRSIGSENELNKRHA